MSDSKHKLYPPSIMSKKMEVISELNPEIKVDQALFEIVWRLESCYEAIEIFDGEFDQCPVCFNCADDSGQLLHKMPEELLN